MVALNNMVARWRTRTGGKSGHLLAKARFWGSNNGRVGGGRRMGGHTRGEEVKP